MSSPDETNAALQSRRRILLGLTMAPLAAALPLAATATHKPGDGATAESGAGYKPNFFKDVEWTCMVAICDRLIPSDDVGPGAVETGVPEFLDRHMQTPYANGAIWYMQGPFLEAPPEFGYQGRLTLRDIIRVGLNAIDAHCRKTFDGKTFAQLEHTRQEELLKAAESGKLKLEDISSKLFFTNILNEVKNGYFADPRYGGNRGMAAWKMIGYPGMRADYLDWITVRDKPYPLPPVDLSGKRG
ncbi:MAG: gluconate 2-dehydrogenase subunit 3 family protein [Luteibacter sp.]|uniref:gluconate 2-dehydrogenase subunit 3 family protein n=1 Tax=Luteibacter TaxID=242605 RepID=UPI0005665936|nr:MULTISPECIES: gluconate 2-dehydrogenase subunit 3 family protein [unclassified Luteibacter]MDQ7995805.1 gluconate 2-dehydrogenase subunit 3 family protein [Luteibacter sp.]MDQ8049093.1 gluconate 2-dehydrogenase subunit 3 family protein [Luteibacter sp.]